MNILVTGANGFLGRQCVSQLGQDANINIRAAVRNKDLVDSSNVVEVGSIDAETQWGQALLGIDAVVHTAARVHVMNESVLDPIVEFRKVNVDGTIVLLREAIKAGVKRFIFISSIKVNGEFTSGMPFCHTDKPKPADAYAKSKYEAEQAIIEIVKGTDIELIIIRPPLIYGQGMAGNLKNLTNLIDKGIPLPLGSIKNKRDLVSIYNLVDLIRHCLIRDVERQQVFLASDNSSVSTSDLIRYLSSNQRGAFLLPVPVKIL